MANVYIPQVPSKYSESMDLRIPTVNLSAAQRYGDIVELLPQDARRVAIGPLVEVLKERLTKYAADDFFVALGDPALIAATAAIIGKKTGGKLRMLKWDKDVKDYFLVEIQV